MNEKAIRTYRIGFPQFLVGLLTVAAIAGGVAWILKLVGVF